MPEPDGTEPIADDELLYRRIPESTGWWDGGQLDRIAFNPRKDDTTGLSVSRAKYTTIEQAAQGREGKRYFVAVLRAGDLRAHGISVEPAPLPGDPGHAEITSIRHEKPKSDRTQNQMMLLATALCLRVEGPFPRSVESQVLHENP